MIEIPTKAGLPYRMGAKLQSTMGYSKLMAQQPEHFRGIYPSLNEIQLNEQLSGYPRNHNYRLVQGKLAPSFRLYERVRLIRSVRPDPVESFLDIGCCRGFYVLDAAQEPTCQAAIGVDVHTPFIDLGNRVAQQMDLSNTAFHLATLDQLTADPVQYQGPFQTILLIGTYHYVYWGSKLSPVAFKSHREILSGLAQLCTRRIIFSGRLELDRLPEDVRQRACTSDRAKEYNTESFVQCAKEFFDVSLGGFLGTYPLLILEKKD